MIKTEDADMKRKSAFPIGNAANETNDAESERMLAAPESTGPRNVAAPQSHDRFAASITWTATYFRRKSLHLLKAFCKCENCDEKEEEEERESDRWRTGYGAVRGMSHRMIFDV